MNNNLDGIANQFLSAYFGTLMGSNRGDLINFYTEASTMTYSGTKYKGLKQIKDKIQSFSFNTICYDKETLNVDVQEGPIAGSLLVLVNAMLNMDNQNTFKFSQVFNICPNGQGGYYCHNDIFSIVL